MTIVDNRYGCELVTEKCKIFVFDAPECMINFKKERSEETNGFRFVLVADFDRPGTLIEASDSFVLRSEKLPSPMGMFITTFSSEKAAQQSQLKYDGQVYSWQQLYDDFEQLPTLQHKQSLVP